MKRYTVSLLVEVLSKLIFCAGSYVLSILRILFVECWKIRRHSRQRERGPPPPHPPHSPKFSPANVYMDIFRIPLSLSTSGWGEKERNAWMEMTIIHQFLLPPLLSSSPANASAKDILFTQCDLFSTDTP